MKDIGTNTGIARIEQRFVLQTYERTLQNKGNGETDIKSFQPMGRIIFFTGIVEK